VAVVAPVETTAQEVEEEAFSMVLQYHFLLLHIQSLSDLVVLMEWYLILLDNNLEVIQPSTL